MQHKRLRQRISKVVLDLVVARFRGAHGDRRAQARVQLARRRSGERFDRTELGQEHLVHKRLVEIERRCRARDEAQLADYLVDLRR